MTHREQREIRRADIYAALQQLGRADVFQLARRSGYSVQTVRTTLRQLGPSVATQDTVRIGTRGPERWIYSLVGRAAVGGEATR